VAVDVPIVGDVRRTLTDLLPQLQAQGDRGGLLIDLRWLRQRSTMTQTYLRRMLTLRC